VGISYVDGVCVWVHKSLWYIVFLPYMSVVLIPYRNHGAYLTYV
jgi:hypothetical protein